MMTITERHTRRKEGVRREALIRFFLTEPDLMLQGALSG